MPSCTSSFKSPALFYAKVLAAICAVLAVLLEISSQCLLKYHSETYERVSQQYSQALNMRPAKPGEPTPVLLVGNSLLLNGIDIERLQQLTTGKLRVYPIFLEATGYYDWLYGLRHLFRQGARPPVVVVGVGVSNFLSDGVREDYAPMMLFGLQDSLSVASDLAMDHTATSNLVLAHESAFWDTRSVFRIQILRHTIPNYRELTLLLKAQPAIPPPPLFDKIAGPRLTRLRALCQSYGARLILLVPPTPGSSEAVHQMTAAANDEHVETLVPLDPAVLPEKFYQSDEIHLNSQGAALFTTALADYLPRELQREPLPSRN